MWVFLSPDSCYMLKLFKSSVSQICVRCLNIFGSKATVVGRCSPMSHQFVWNSTVLDDSLSDSSQLQTSDETNTDLQVMHSAYFVSTTFIKWI